MAVPELYRFGREGYWFNQKSFVIYMLDGLVQVSASFHLLPWSVIQF